MAVPCYHAYSCPRGPQSVAKPVSKSWYDGVTPNIVIQVDPDGSFSDALEVVTAELVESTPIVAIDSGETNCAKARKKYGL